jgi:hypothetical protein
MRVVFRILLTTAIPNERCHGIAQHVSADSRHFGVYRDRCAAAADSDYSDKGSRSSVAPSKN